MSQMTQNLAGGCPVSGIGTEYDPYRHEGMYSFFRRARRECPIFYQPDLGVWVVTRRADIEAVFRDNLRFSAFVASAPICPVPQEALGFFAASDYTAEPVHVNLDGPAHMHIRRIAARFLNVKVFAGYEDAIRALVRDYIAELRGRDTVDIIDAMIYEFPARVLFLLLGETGVDPLKIKAWADKRLLLMFGKLDHDEVMDASREIVDFWTYTKGIVAARHKTPADDYPSFLLEMRGGDDSILTINQIESMLFALLLAGHETTTNASGNLLNELLSAPDQWAKLVADPSLAGAAVEEGLRHASSVVTWRRQALEDLEIAGQLVRKGEVVLLALGSANRDEGHFDDGEVFDIERRNARDHFAFGKGLHMCLGAPLARLEMRVLLEELSAAFPRLQLVENQEIDWIPTITFRGPKSLWVRLNGA
ncbi:cytochrome P450 [Mesobacterium pallidum]|uniref:cytochrome P450 n=1 Tax=Mesobacterium pallidum TaxID=2872037 RepID=UPI001EE2C49C|nr:cytochrome P450 [Mesobacterium pallidum]